MRKILLQKLSSLLLVIALSGCASTGPVVDVLNPFNFISTGFYPLLIVAELETNLSSIVIDKTEAKIESQVVNPYNILPENASIYVMPAIISVRGETSYSKYYSSMISNYLMLNSFAIPVNNIEDADYVIRVDISESPDRHIGKNFAGLALTIMEINENPVFYTNIKITSKSDKNFYYYPSKSARPVKELTLYGLEKTFEDALPQAFAATNIN